MNRREAFRAVATAAVAVTSGGVAITRQNEPLDTGSDELNACLDDLRRWCEDDTAGDPIEEICNALDAAGRAPFQDVDPDRGIERAR